MSEHKRTQAEAVEQRAALAAQESEERFSALAECAPVGIAISVDGRLTWANQVCAAIVGWSASELIGREVLSFVAPRSQQDVANRFARLVRERSASGWNDVHIIRKDGQERIIAGRSSYVRHHGRDAVMSVMWDVTDERRIQARLAQQKRELAAFGNIAMALGRSLDLPAVLEVALEQTSALTGADAGSIALVDSGGQFLQLVAHRNLPPALVSRLVRLELEHSWEAEVCDTGQVLVISDAARYPTVLPQTITCGFRSFVAVPLKSQDQVVGVLNLAHRQKDHFSVTPLSLLVALGSQIGAAITNARLFNELGQSEYHYRTLFEIIRQPIALVAAEDDSLVRWNSAFGEHCGYADEELAAMSFEELIAPQDRPEFGWLKRACLSGLSAPDSCDVGYVCKGGERREVVLAVSAYCAPAHDQQELRGLLVVVRDLTQERRLRQDLLRSEKLAALGQLVSGVAHEFSNPIAAILLAAELLLAQESDPAKVACLQGIIHEAQQAGALSADLQLFARHEPPQRTPVDLVALIQRVCNLAEPAFRREGLEIITRVQDPIPRVVGDASRLEQVCLNLMNNARQAMTGQQSGPGRLTITVAGDASEGTMQVDGVRLTFSDAGPGVPLELRERIFEPFFTTKPPGQGTGLGLAISAAIIEAHGGTLALVEAEKGASFEICLPASAAQAPDVHSSAAVPAGKMNDVAGLRALIIDDGPNFALFLEDMLHSLDCQADTAHSGTDALALAREGDYDIVLCDLTLPGMDGRELARELCGDAPDLEGRFIFMGGGIAAVEEGRGLSGAPSVILQKPFTRAQLISAIRRVMPPARRSLSG